jgi:hypothetical protein
MAAAKIVSKNSLSIKGIITVTDNNEIMVEIEDVTEPISLLSLLEDNGLVEKDVSISVNSSVELM